MKPNKKESKVDFDKVVLVQKPIHMSYHTYVYLRDLIVRGREMLHHDFISAHDFIPPQSAKDIRNGLVSGRQIANDIFREKDLVFSGMLKELHAAAKASNANNPSEGMRKFWGIEE